MATSTFSIAAGGDDKHVYRLGTAYPPLGAITHDATNGSLVVSRTGGTNKQLSNVLMKWDTSSLPDAAIITSALLRVQVTNIFNFDTLSLTMDWHVLDGTDSDYSATPLTTAHSGTALGSITNGVSNDFALSNLSNISKTGVTGIRAHISQRPSDVAPAGGNEVWFAAFEDPSAAEPRLIVTYALGSDLVGSVGI